MTFINVNKLILTKTDFSQIATEVCMYCKLNCETFNKCDDYNWKLEEIQDISI